MSISCQDVCQVKTFTSLASQNLLVVDKSEPHTLHGVQGQAVSISVSAIDENALMRKVEHVDYGMSGEERCQLACQREHEKYERER